ncbi:unnamed protein product [Closterium sp. NIES-65]|nr:unnamed protein product [Closterium sp. NIES-65]
MAAAWGVQVGTMTSIPSTSISQAHLPSAHGLLRGSFAGPTTCRNTISWQLGVTTPLGRTSNTTRRVFSVRAASSGAATEEPHTRSSSAAMERTANSLYDLLGLSRRDASLEEIKGAYRMLARRYHPDVRPEGLTLEECTQRFIEVQEAYEVLSDPQRRAMYDFEMLHPASAKAGAHPWRREAGWRRGVARPWSTVDSPWQSPEEEEQMRTAWRAQWGSQLSGLKQRARAQSKPGSWAARMRQEHGGESA